MITGPIRGALLMIVAIAGEVVSAQSPDADIEAVQRKLDAAKQAQAEAKRAADQRAARATASAAAQANMATLVVRSDHECLLSIDGRKTQDIGPATTANLRVEPGDQLIECVSTRFPNTVRYQQVKPLSPGSKSVVLIELEANSEDLDRAGRAHNRFVVQGSVVKDNETGLVWADHDNGSYIDWVGARSYCASLGVGWTLPTVGQLQSLYDSGVQTQPNGDSTWKVTQSIRLSACCAWTNEPISTSEAWLVHLGNGVRTSLAIINPDLTRALCVRSS